MGRRTKTSPLRGPTVRVQPRTDDARVLWQAYELTPDPADLEAARAEGRPPQRMPVAAFAADYLGVDASMWRRYMHGEHPVGELVMLRARHYVAKGTARLAGGRVRPPVPRGGHRSAWQRYLAGEITYAEYRARKAVAADQRRHRTADVTAATAMRRAAGVAARATADAAISAASGRAPVGPS